MRGYLEDELDVFETDEVSQLRGQISGLGQDIEQWLAYILEIWASEKDESIKPTDRPKPH